ncbi:hypothetical protein TCDM_01467 [Trypanosoma cruzi Dm28c]|uniref:Uncharacterized protein n=1 Tax=Trypanosoma cruzi Dm28c TaxID=1416333 RepID=V5BYZ2_TRYCR|nr:hypothetical protein TCDM_01467 [Trypanosoma cruzi Dm28c]
MASLCATATGQSFCSGRRPPQAARRVAAAAVQCGACDALAAQGQAECNLPPGRRAQEAPTQPPPRRPLPTKHPPHFPSCPSVGCSRRPQKIYSPAPADCGCTPGTAKNTTFPAPPRQRCVFRRPAPSSPRRKRGRPSLCKRMPHTTRWRLDHKMPAARPPQYASQKRKKRRKRDRQKKKKVSPLRLPSLSNTHTHTQIFVLPSVIASHKRPIPPS